MNNANQNRRVICIDQVTVRMSGIPPESGRRATEGLGDAIGSALAERLGGARKSVRIPEIHAAAEPSAVPRSPEQIRAAIVDAVAKRVTES